jgi:hypothetical protein
MADVPFPEMPPQLRETFPPSFWNWWQAFRVFLTTSFFTSGSVTLITASKGVQLVSPNGTKYLVTVDNAGNLVTTLVP